MLDTAKAPLNVSSHARNWNNGAGSWSHDNLDFPGNIHTTTTLLRTTVIPSPTINSITNYRFHHQQKHRRRFATAATILVHKNNNVGGILLFQRQTNLLLPWRPCPCGWSASVKGWNGSRLRSASLGNISHSSVL
jgi:hypothetical protein